MGDAQELTFQETLEKLHSFLGLACYVSVSVGEADEHLLVCEFLGVLERGVAHPGL